MIKLFQFLVSGCWHNWKFMREVTLLEWCDYNKKDVPTGTKRVYVCIRCGRTKTHRY